MAITAPWDRNAFMIALKTVCFAATGLVFIKSGQPSPAPSLPYGTFKILAGMQPLYGLAPATVVHDATAPAGEESVLHYGGQTTLRVRFQTFTDQASASADALSYLEKLSSYLSTDASDLILNPILLSTPPAPPADITALVGALQQSRATLDVDFNGALDITESTGYIDKVIVTQNTVDGIDGAIVGTSTQTINGV